MRPSKDFGEITSTIRVETIGDVRKVVAREVHLSRRSWLMRVSVTICVFFLLSTGCGPTTSVVSRKPIQTDEITIGVAYGFSVRQDLMRNGLEMAVDEVNKEGGILGKKLRLRVEDDLRSVTRGGVVAQSFINDPNVVAVIGHGSSTVSISVSPMYDKAGLTLLTPSSSSPLLTQAGLVHVFRGSFNDAAPAKEAGEIARGKG